MAKLREPSEIDQPRRATSGLLWRPPLHNEYPFTAKTRALRALHEQRLANLALPAVTADHLSRPAAFGSIGVAYLSKDKIVRWSVQWWRWRTSH